MSTPMSEPEKLDLRSHDVVGEKKAELFRLFPEVRCGDGKIDFEHLRRVLGETVEVGRERYGMNWPGKADCFKTIQKPSLATLRPCPEESVNFDTTENLIIEGDNLEVLKLLQKSYLGEVKMIYIDPPYNTGNDFIYPDNYSESLDTYLRYTGQVDSEGRKYSTNTEADGRFHSKWLNMMYPRLYLARNLLREDGVIFISIDDAEVDNLKKLCNEIFGEENFIAQLVWEKGRKNDAKFFSIGHEYLLVYAKSLGSLREAKTVWREQKPGAKEIWEEYVRLRGKHGDNNRLIEVDLQSWFQGLPKTHPSKKLSRYKRVDGNGPWRDRDISWPGDGPHKYPIIHPVTKQPCKIPESGWRFAEDEMQRQIRLGLVEFRADHTEPPFRKAHIKPVVEELAVELTDDEDDGEDDEEMATQVRGSYVYKQSQVAVKYLKRLMGAKVFNNPKDHVELLRFIRYVTMNDDDAIILDFFGGSGTTAESVLTLNAEDHSNRRFILVQLPEKCDPKDKVGKSAIAAGYKTISDIAKERVRRVIKKLNAEDAGQLALGNGSKPDRGFQVFKLAESNFRVWDASAIPPGDEAGLAQQLDLHVQHIVDGRTESDLLHEILLKSGIPVTTPIEKLTLAGKTVYSIADGGMLICLERALTHEVIAAMAGRNPLPERIVCLDEGFAGNDQLKVNAVETMKVKGVTSFRTV